MDSEASRKQVRRPWAVGSPFARRGRRAHASDACAATNAAGTPAPPPCVQLENIRSFILLEAREKADEIRMKVGSARASREWPLLAVAVCRGGPFIAGPPPVADPVAAVLLQAKGDADKERQELVLSAKNKIAADYDRKEKQLAMDQRM